jgi:hypothetical protein
MMLFNNQVIINPFLVAAANGSVHALRALYPLDPGMMLDLEVDTGRETLWPLQLACGSEDPAALEQLLDWGASHYCEQQAGRGLGLPARYDQAVVVSAAVLAGCTW